MSRGEFCVFCTVPGTSGRISLPCLENIQKWVQDSATNIGLYIDNCWASGRKYKREESLKLYIPHGYLTLGSPEVSVQHFGDQDLSSGDRFLQSPRMTWQSLHLQHNVSLIMSSKKLQDLIQAQAELEKKVQRELEIKAQIEEKTVQLNVELMKARAQRKQLINDHCQMQAEIQPFLDDSHLLMGYVPDPTKKKQMAPIKVWDQQTQQLEQMQWQQKEMVSSYESHISVLRKELLQLEELQVHLKKKIQALNARRTLQLSQEEHIKSLQMEKPRVQKEAEENLRRAQSNLIKEWRALKNQLSNVEMMLLGKNMMGKHNHEMEHAANKSFLNFTCHLQQENNKLHKEMVQLVQEVQHLEAQKTKLRKQKQQLQLEQCCLESIKQGRRRKLLRIIPCQEEESSPKTTLDSLQATKPKMNSS